MADAWVWWVGLAAAVLLLAVPTLLMLRRSASRRVPLFGPGGVRPPGWAYLLLFPGLVLLGYGAHGLAGGDEGRLTYFAGGGAVSLALQLGLVIRHNRRVASSAGADRPEHAGGGI